MPRLPIIETGNGTLPEPNSIIPQKDGKIGIEAIVQMNAVQLAVIRKLNRFIHLGTGINATRPGNLDAQYLSFVTPSVSDTEFELPHGLLRVPVIMVPCMTNKAGTLYADRYQSWTTDRILLKHSGTSAEMIIILA